MPDDENPTFRRFARNTLHELSTAYADNAHDVWERDVRAIQKALRVAYERGVEDGRQRRESAWTAAEVEQVKRDAKALDDVLPPLRNACAVCGTATTRKATTPLNGEVWCCDKIDCFEELCRRRRPYLGSPTDLGLPGRGDSLIHTCPETARPNVFDLACAACVDALRDHGFDYEGHERRVLMRQFGITEQQVSDYMKQFKSAPSSSLAITTRLAPTCYEVRSGDAILAECWSQSVAECIAAALAGQFTRVTPGDAPKGGT